MSVEVISIGKVNVDLTLVVDRLPRGSGHIHVIESNVSVGGSAANFASQSARLGVKTGLVSCIGTDSNGSMALKYIAQAGVDTRHVLVLDRHQTGFFVNVQDGSGSSVVFVDLGANRFLDKHTLDEEYVTRAHVIHVAGGFPRMMNLAAEMATTNGILLSLDPGRAAEAVDYSKILRFTDLLFVNRSELRKYFKIEPSKSALKKFAKTFPGIVIVKQGRKGAVATDGFEYLTSDIFEVPVADTLGAGDSFAAGFVMAWVRTDRIDLALNVANAVAALTIGQRGAQTGQPDLDKTSKFLAGHGISIEPVLRTFASGSRRKRR